MKLGEQREWTTGSRVHRRDLHDTKAMCLARRDGDDICQGDRVPVRRRHGRKTAMAKKADIKFIDYLQEKYGLETRAGKFCTN